MKTNHTPGPWEYSDIFCGSHTPRRAEIRAPGGYREVCAVYYHVIEDDIAQTRAKANARLIAAAPDLLAALETLADLCEERGLYPVNVKDARAAIAKATQL